MNQESMNENTSEVKIPTEKEFLQSIWNHEDKLEGDFDEIVPKLGKKTPACLENIGVVLSYLDRMASCWWKCQGGNHEIERICARVATHARAALRLVRFGFYDEALILCRGIGEAANLMQLFIFEKESFKDWIQSDPKKVQKNFSPVKVRLRLEKADTPPIINEERYRKLSGRFSHVRPDNSPQSHNLLGVSSATPIIQEAGIIVCLNELALPLACIAIFGANILDHKKSVVREITFHSKELLDVTGGVSIESIDDIQRARVRQFKDNIIKDIEKYESFRHRLTLYDRR